MHTHPFHEVLCCHVGEGTQWTPAGAFPIRAGDVLFLPAGLPHVARSSEWQPCAVLVMNLPGARLENRGALGHLIRHLREEGQAGRSRLALTTATAMRVRQIFEQLLEEQTACRPAYEAASQSLAEQLLVQLLRDPHILPALEGAMRPDAGRERLSRVVAHIHRHYMAPISVGHMATVACLSRSHFHAEFKRHTGQTLVEYVNRVRVMAAGDLLRATSQPILDVAENVGFRNLSHFYREFSKATGDTPRGYRLAAQPQRT